MRHHEVISFVNKLMERVKLDPNLNPNEVHVFNVHAAYGHYQVIIGPAGKVARHSVNNRPIEINGSLHHLFVSKNHITPHPSHNQIQNNLKGCVIMRDLTLHMKDPTGAGRKLDAQTKQNALYVREKINLAGNDGDKFLKRMENTGKLAKDTYKIVQEDILNALAMKQYTQG